MACYWIALIPLRCSGNQATILLEALVLMANLVDLMVGSIQLGLVGTREEEHPVLTIYLISQIYGSDRPNRKHQQCRVYCSIAKPITIHIAAYSWC